MTTSTPVGYIIQSSIQQDSASHRLFINHREQRGNIVNPEITQTLDAGGKVSGFFLGFVAEDGEVEQIGDKGRPLPLELLDELMGDGLVIINLDLETRQICGGQALKLDVAEEDRPRMRA